MKKIIFLVVLLACWVPTSRGWNLSADEQKIINVSPPLSVVLLRNEEFFHRLLKEIKESKKEIDMAMYLIRAGNVGISHRPSGSPGNRVETILNALVNAARRGVKVRVILERSLEPGDTVTSDNREAGMRLKEGGVEVNFDSLRRRSHSKVVVIDSRLTFIGSHNFTEAALGFNNELSVLIDSPECASMAKRYIASLRRRD